MEERFRVELSLNIWVENDEQARMVAQNICAEQQKRFDNRWQVMRIFESPFGSLREREVQLELF